MPFQSITLNLANVLLSIFFLACSMMVIVGFSNHICHIAKHYLDGMFFGSLFLLMSIMMLHKYWDSITMEDWEFNLGGAPHIWHVQNTMQFITI